MDYDKSRVAPFISPDQRRASAVLSDRGNLRGSRRPLGSRPGLGYGWAAFDAQRDDEKTSREALAGSSHPLAGTAIQDIFRPVTLDDHGVRNVGKSIIARTSPSPEKDNNGVLTFKDDVETVVLGTSSLNLGHGGISNAPAKYGSAIPPAPGGLRQHDTNVTPSQLQAGGITLGSHSQPRESSWSSNITTAPAGYRADKPEWELPTYSDTTFVARKSDNEVEGDAAVGLSSDVGEDDLITF